MTSMFVPEPVISLAINPVDNKAQINMSKALNRFTKEDPTFKHLRQRGDQREPSSGHGRTAPGGVHRTHAREYKAEVTTGQPQVAYRETITRGRSSTTPTKSRPAVQASTAGGRLHRTHAMKEEFRI
jgi:elongation factor G